MQNQFKILQIIICFVLLPNKTVAFSYPDLVQKKTDDIVLKHRANQKNILQNSINSYKEVLIEKHPTTDSVEVFKIIALTSSKLGNSKELPG